MPELPTLSPPSIPGGAKRLRFIDGLRGIAALWVTGYHLYGFGHLTEPLSRVLPPVGRVILLHGFLGVDLFFVMSGFVMALSLRGAMIGPRYFGNFALRRSLRLDPPYWLTLWAAVVLDRLATRYAPALVGPGKGISLPDLLVSMVYLQTLLHRPVILNVAWTLCYEVQFYLVLTLLCWLGQRLAKHRHHAAYLALFLPTGIWSVGILAGWCPNPLTGLFLDRWFMFVLGVIAFWAWDRKVSPIAFWGFAAVVLAGVIHSRDLDAAAAWSTAVIITLVGYRNGGLEHWLGNALLQSLGRISYSLYLVHTLVGMKLMWVGAKLTRASVPLALAWFVLALCLSVVTAWGMYLGVERWGIALGKRIKHGGPGSTPGPGSLETESSRPPAMVVGG